MSVEGLKAVFDIAAVVLLFFTFAAGAGVLITGNIIDGRQKEKLRQFDNDLTIAKSDLAKQQERAATAEARIASAQAEAATAAQKSAEANAIAEGERLERVRLEGHILPRRLSGTRIQQLSNSLKQKVGGIVIVSALVDSESSDFADDFDTAFKNAGWKTLRYRNRITEERGVELGTVVGTNDGGGVDEISKLIRTVGVQVVPTSFKEDDHTTSPWFEKNALYLVINHKPELTTERAEAK